MFDNLFKNPPSITDYGNGVFRFRFHGNTFGVELSNFIKDNPTLKVISVVYEAENSYQGTFFVITEPRN